eukprot:6098271-Amphidinium_carterae.1
MKVSQLHAPRVHRAAHSHHLGLQRLQLPRQAAEPPSSMHSEVAATFTRLGAASMHWNTAGELQIASSSLLTASSFIGAWTTTRAARVANWLPVPSTTCQHQGSNDDRCIGGCTLRCLLFHVLP